MPRTNSTKSLGLRKVKEFSGWWKTYEGISNGTDGLGYSGLDAKTFITEDWVIVPFSAAGSSGVYIYPRNSNTALYTITVPNGTTPTDIAATNTHIVMSNYSDDDVWLYTIADLQPGNNTAFTWTSSLPGIYGADLAINSTHVFISDSSNNRVRVVTLNGTFVTTINNPNVEPSDSNDQFYYLAANDSFLAVGAAAEDLNGSNEGVVYLFSTSNWSQEYLIEAPGPGTRFGFNVQINDNYLVVGQSLSNDAWVYTLNELPTAPATVTTPNYRINAVASTGNYDGTRSQYMTLSSGNTHWLAMPEGLNNGNWLSVWNIENLTAYPAVNQTAEKYLTSVYANSWAQWPGVDVSNTELTIVTPNTTNNGWTQYNKFFKPKRAPRPQRLFNTTSYGVVEQVTQTITQPTFWDQRGTTQNLGFNAYNRGTGPVLDISSFTSNLTDPFDVITVEGWVYLDQIPSGDRHLFGLHKFQDGNTGTFVGDQHTFLFLTSTGTLSAKRQINGSGSTGPLNGTTPLATGTWHHMGFSLIGKFTGVNSTNIKGYLNGVASTSNQAVGTNQQLNCSQFPYMSFGAWYDWNSQEMGGSTDYGYSQVRVYQGYPDGVDESSTSYTIPTTSWNSY